MKKYIRTIALLSLLVAGVSFSACAQVYVNIRPAAPVIVRPVAPSPRHVWVDGGWAVRGGRYVWTDGYWVVPRRGHHYIPGRWDHRRGGWVWVGGYWRR